MSADPQLINASAGPPGQTREREHAERVSWQVAVVAGRFEAVRLCRSPLVLAGLVIAAALIWWNSRAMVPQWWVWDVQVGSSLLPVAGTVLVASHLAAGRVRRDGATALYQSYPATPATRAAAHALGVAGPLILAAVLAVAAVSWLDFLGPVGAPQPAVLAQGVLLVALGGTIGVALGTYLPHPVAGILAAIVLGLLEADLLVPFGGPLQLPAGTAWLFPWTQPAVLAWLPGPKPAIPPPAHLSWLVSLTVLAAVAALWRGVPRPPLARGTRLTALVAAGCLGLAGWSGWAQTHPGPAGAQAAAAYQATHPGQAERCVSRRGVRYCSYPGFGHDVTRWATVVNGVISRVPAHLARPLVVRQVVDVNLYTAPLYGGYPPATAGQASLMSRLEAEVGRFASAQKYDPRLIPGSSVPPVYADINWATGSTAGWYQLGLAMQAARSIARLPTTWQRSASYSCGPECSAQAQIACLPVGQAREAIALWLGAGATAATRPVFLSELRDGQEASRAGGAWISSYSGVTGYGYQAALQFTGQAAVLARAMLRLPERQVEAVLATRWPAWLSPRATDAQLAAALRIALPAAPPAPVSASDRGQPADPVCR